MVSVREPSEASAETGKATKRSAAIMPVKKDVSLPFIVRYLRLNKICLSTRKDYPTTEEIARIRQTPQKPKGAAMIHKHLLHRLVVPP